MVIFDIIFFLSGVHTCHLEGVILGSENCGFGLKSQKKLDLEENIFGGTPRFVIFFAYTNTKVGY
jgi:hypothetical protein